MDYFFQAAAPSAPVGYLLRARDGQFCDGNGVYSATPTPLTGTVATDPNHWQWTFSGLTEEEHSFAFYDAVTPIFFPPATIATGLNLQFSDANKEALGTAFLQLTGVMVGGYSLGQLLEYFLAILTGICNGPPPGTAGIVNFRNLANNANKVQCNVNANGYRTSSTLG